MKYVPKIQTVIIASVAAALLSPHADVTPRIKGHFTQRHADQFVYFIPPQLNAGEDACVNGDCTATLHFSDAAIPAIAIKSCIGGKPVNLGDLDNDGLDEIGLLPEWFTSCWRNFYVFTYKHGHWQNAVPPITTHCNQWEANVKPIVKDPQHPGNVIISYSAFRGKEIVTERKSIPVK